MARQRDWQANAKKKGGKKMNRGWKIIQLFFLLVNLSFVFFWLADLEFSGVSLYLTVNAFALGCLFLPILGWMFFDD